MDNTEVKKLKTDAIATHTYAKGYWLDNYDDLFRANWKVYKRITDSNYPLDSKLFPPTVFANCVLILSLLLDAVFGSRDVVSFAANSQVSTKHAREMDNLIDTQFERTRFFWSAWEHFQEAEIFPYSIGKIIWSKEFNSPVFNAVSPWDVYFDPSCAWDIQKAGYIHHTVLRTVQQVKEMRDMGIYEITDEEITAIKKSPSRRKDDETSYYLQQYDSNDLLDVIEVVESHMGDKIITLLGGAVESAIVGRVIDKPIPLYPFVKTCLFPEHDEAHGEGLINPAKDIQLAQQNIFNLIQLAGQKALSPGFITDDENFEEEQFIWTPDGIVVVERGSMFKELTPPDINPIFGKAEADLRYHIDNSMGVPPLMRGEKEGAQETLGGMMIRKESGGARTNLHIYAIGKTIEDIVNIMIEYNGRYFAEELFLDRDTGEEIIMSFADIMGSKDYKFVPICNTTPLKPMAQERANILYDKMVTNPLVNQQGLLEWFVDSQEIKEKHKLLNPEGMGQMIPGMEGMANNPQIPGNNALPPMPEQIPEGVPMQ